MEERVFRAVELCQAIGNTTRYRILRVLAEDRMTPGALCKRLRKSPPVISVHLSKLRAAGLVRFKRESTGLMYWLKAPGIVEIMNRLESLAPAGPE